MDVNARHWITVVWMLVMAAFGATASYRLYGTTRESVAAPREAGGARDDAEAVLAAFGPADEDQATGVTPLDSPVAVRIIVFRTRRVRATFFRRSRGSPPRSLWTLVGFTEPDGRTVISGEEALRRLVSGR